eukprot:1586608-Rhodomonas_salina.3
MSVPRVRRQIASRSDQDTHHTLCQYRTSRSTIRYVSTGSRVAPYAMSVPDIYSRSERAREREREELTNLGSRRFSSTATLRSGACPRRPGSAIRWLSTVHRVASYARSVQDIAQQRTLGPYQTSHSIIR